MAHQIPYEGDTVFPPNDLIMGNENSDSRVEFDIVPAWGPDLARIKSIIFAATGLVHARDWTPDMQASVTAAFETGGEAFINIITAIRNLTIPAIMAVRAGLLPEIPRRPDPNNPTQLVPDPKAPYQVLNGVAFYRICGAVPAMGLFVASKVAELSRNAESDPRFFGQPSGSGGTGKRKKAKGSTAKTARSTSRRRGTAGKHSKGVTPPSDAAGSSTTGT